LKPGSLFASLANSLRGRMVAMTCLSNSSHFMLRGLGRRDATLINRYESRELAIARQLVPDLEGI